MTRPPNRLLALTAVAALAMTACGRPREPLEIGMREVASDIVLGAQAGDETPPPPPPVPPTPVVISVPVPRARPAFQPVPPPVATPAPTPTADPCPEDNPLQAPSHDARRDVATPPHEETLTYRNEGAFTVAGANANEGTFTGDSLRSVSNVVVDDAGDFTYDVHAELGGTTTVTSYRVINTPPSDELVPLFTTGNVNDTRGLYLVATQTTGPDGTASTFRPVPEMMLLPFPGVLNTQFTSAGTDATTGMSMAYSGTVGASVRINACGTPLTGIEVRLTDGTVTGPQTNVEFTATYVFATQFGGLSIDDMFTIAGTEGADTTSRTNHATVSQGPTFGPDATDGGS